MKECSSILFISGRFWKDISSIEFLFCPVDTSLPQWLIPQLNEILLKIKRWQWNAPGSTGGCFQVADKQQGVYPTALLYSPWISQSGFTIDLSQSQERLTEPVFMKSVRTIINGMLSNLLLLKFQLFTIDGPIVKAALKAVFYFLPKGSLFLCFSL